MCWKHGIITLPNPIPTWGVKYNSQHHNGNLITKDALTPHAEPHHVSCYVSQALLSRERTILCVILLILSALQPNMCTQNWKRYTCGHLVFDSWSPCDERGFDQCSNLAINTNHQTSKCDTCSYPTPPDSD
ncbi:hypothetical protein VTK73DRAFT_7192 [Phialemonium thermophilum]|uniref:ShKT domain-containing protein n=1 Tax=Phialemonium thermophilum TaxID=223376 RepID=A0ABR3WFX2_9PEZI